MTASYSTILLCHSVNEQNALSLFFKLWEEFLLDQSLPISNGNNLFKSQNKINVEYFISYARKRYGMYLFADDCYSIRGLFDGYSYAIEDDNTLSEFNEWLIIEHFPIFKNTKNFNWHKVLLVFCSSGGEIKKIDRFFQLWDEFTTAR